MQGILLAAGYGRRFDPTGGRDKLLAPAADGRPVAWHSARRLCQVLPLSLAVIRPGSPLLSRVLADAGCMVLESEEAARGMGSALAHAVRETANGAGWLVALADMPWVPEGVIAAVAAAVGAPGAVAAPVFAGRRGHPVAFGAAWGPRLAALEGDEGARKLLLRAYVHLIATDDEGVLRDVDTPGDLKARQGPTRGSREQDRASSRS